MVSVPLDFAREIIEILKPIIPVPRPVVCEFRELIFHSTNILESSP
jgi:hypothetical protein